MKPALYIKGYTILSTLCHPFDVVQTGFDYATINIRDF